MINCWTENEEIEQLNKLLQSFNNSNDILNEISNDFVKLVSMQQMELDGLPKQYELEKMIDFVLKKLYNAQKKLNQYHNEILDLNDKFSFYSFFARCQCFIFDSQLIALNETFSIVAKQLMEYKTKIKRLKKFKYKFVFKQIIDFRNDFPSFADIEYLKEMLHILNGNIQHFYLDKKDNAPDELKAEIIKDLAKIKVNSETISYKLDKIHSDLVKELELSGEQLSIKDNYNLCRISRTHSAISKVCSIYENKIISGNVPPNINGCLKNIDQCNYLWIWQCFLQLTIILIWM